MRASKMNLITVNIVGSLPRCLVRTFASLACISLAMAQSPVTFAATGNLIASVPSPQATLLSNGKVLVTGFPCNKKKSNSLAEILDLGS